MQAPGDLALNVLDTWTKAAALAQEKARQHAERYSDPSRFMTVYDETLHALHWGADVLERRRLGNDLDAAAEAEAMAAHRLIMSHVHGRRSTVK